MKRAALLLLWLVAARTGAQDPPAAGPVGAWPEPPSGPRYPVPLEAPDFTAPGRPFTVYDLRYGFSDTFATTHSFAARVRVGHLGLAALETLGERRALTLETHRVFVSAGATEGAYDLSASYRGARFLLSGAAERGAGRDEDWLVAPSLAVRVAPGLDLVGRLSGDAGERPGDFVRTWSVGFLWQRGARFEAAGEYARAREAVAARRENVRERGALGVLAQLGPVELSGEGAVEEVRGLFPYRQLAGELGARTVLAPRLLLEGSARARSEAVVGEIETSYGGAVTWFARPFRLPRAGTAAERAVALAREAVERGLFERREFDEDRLRAQRERLSLSPWRTDLADAMSALYHVQVAERAVPSLGLAFEVRRQAFSRLRSRTLRATAGVPWPPAWPWQGRDDAVPFVRLDLERERLVSGPRYVALRHGVGLTVSLNREMDLLLRWGRQEPTPLDLIRGVGERRTVEVACVYAFGR